MKAIQKEKPADTLSGSSGGQPPGGGGKRSEAIAAGEHTPHSKPYDAFPKEKPKDGRDKKNLLSISKELNRQTDESDNDYSTAPLSQLAQSRQIKDDLPISPSSPQRGLTRRLGREKLHVGIAPPEPLYDLSYRGGSRGISLVSNPFILITITVIFMAIPLGYSLYRFVRKEK